MIDSGLEFEDRRVGEDLSQFVRNIFRIIKNQNLAVDIAKNEDRPSRFSLFVASIEFELPVTLRVEAEEVILPN